MFSRATDASKVALAWLVARLIVGGFRLLDCQFMTDHLRSLGAIEVTQQRYLEMLSAELEGAGVFPVVRRRRRGGLGRRAAPVAPEFGALDRLLAASAGASSDGGGRRDASSRSS